MATQYISAGEIVRKWSIPAGTVDSWRKNKPELRVLTPTTVTTVGGLVVNTKFRTVYRLEEILVIISRRQQFKISDKWWEYELPEGWEKLNTVAKQVGISHSTLRRAVKFKQIKSKEIEAYGTRYGKTVLLWKADVEKFKALGRGRSSGKASTSPDAPLSSTERVLSKFKLPRIDEHDESRRRLTRVSDEEIRNWAATLKTYKPYPTPPSRDSL